MQIAQNVDDSCHPNTLEHKMSTSKEVQLDCRGQSRRTRSPIEARINTAHADPVPVDSAVQLVNNVEVPTSDPDFQVPDSPSLQKFIRPKHEENSKPLLLEQGVPLFQRPTSSGSAPQHHGFAFRARQQKTLQVRIERPREILGRQSLPEHSSQDSQVAEQAVDDLAAVQHDEEQRYDTDFLQTPQILLTGIYDSSPPIDRPTTALQIVIDNSCGTMSNLPHVSLAGVDQQEQRGLSTHQSPPTVDITSDKEEQEHRTMQPQKGGNMEVVTEKPAPSPAAANADTDIQSPLSIMPVKTAPIMTNQKHSQTTRNPVHRRLGTRVPKQTAALIPTSFQPLNLPSGELREAIQENTAAPKAERNGDSHITEPPTNDLIQRLESVCDTKALDDDQASAATSEFSHGAQELHVGQEETRPVELHIPHTSPQARRPVAEKPSKVVKPTIRPKSTHIPSEPRNSFDIARFNPPVALNGTVAPPSGGGPSEEDLFYLLMHRQRQRKDVETRLMARYKQLEDSNARLNIQNRQYKSQLDAGRACQDKSSSELSNQKAALEDFKARFSKLKSFVNGLSNDYHGLRQEADKIKSSQQALSIEKEDVNRELQAMRTASTTAERSLRSISAHMGNIRADVAPLEQSLHDTQVTLRVERSLLLKEQRKIQRLETYLVQVASTQNRYSVAIQDEQKVMLEQLRLITKKITTVQDVTSAEPQPLDLPGLNECLKIVKVLHDADRVAPADITKVADAVTTLSHRSVPSLQSQ